MIAPDSSNVSIEKQARLHLKIFLAQRSDILELTQSAIYLLKAVPASRPAVLEHLEQVFESAVEKSQAQDGPTQGNLSTNASSQMAVVIRQVHQALYSLVKTSPAVWAQLVSPWSLQLLGHLSSKFADRRSGLKLAEVMQRWMSCPPMRSLIDITSQCVLNAADLDTDRCINALLDTTIRYSPHFDWVVAHIGSSFPHTVITRVLTVGLKHFLTQEPGVVDSNKLVSVVGILGHLAGQHSGDIKKALADMLSGSLCDKPTSEQLVVIPYLLDLSIMSELLLTSVVSDLPLIMTATNLNRLVEHTRLRTMNKTPGMHNAQKVFVDLFLKCGRNEHEALALLSLALRIKQKKVAEVREEVIAYTTSFLDRLLIELQKRVYSKASVPLLVSFELRAKELLSQLDLTCPWTISFISLTCLHSSEKMRFLVEMLITKTDPPIFLQIISHIETSQPTVLIDSLNALIVELRSGRVSDPILVLRNLRKLVVIEERAKKILWKFADTLSLHSSDCNLEYTAEIVSLLGVCSLPSEEIPESTLYKIICAAVVVLFAAARISDKDQHEKKIQWMISSLKLFSATSSNALAQQMALRLLLDGVTDSNTCRLFGAIPRDADRVLKPHTMTSLLEENRKIVASINFPQSHSSIMRAGVVGDGLRAKQFSIGQVLADYLIRENQKCFIRALKECCAADKSHQGMISIATILCDIVNPDVMFNHPVWPTEDVLKATQEKDVDIRESFRANPMLWQILTLVANEDPPALNSAAVIIRSLLGCQMTFWKNSQDSYMCPEQKDMTVKVLKLMGLGKMLPSPLAEVPLIVDHINSFHLYCILNDIWNYMREVGGTLMEEEPVPARFTNNLRIIMLNQMDRVGAAYAKMFPVN
ncbi:integrator complex subunit 5-like [Varroa jacobsoni]|uniref:Integrator complex subunit 5 n=1 Tax=Varroa destructor TaxID=109461 RepID=A0A7M7JCJ9_VARDE|nr:integrator complex subunit 5-like [Varroa destructor]XP_022709254.1 integrator complex subunit 5-like [Varroa jacobsoni]